MNHKQRKTFTVPIKLTPYQRKVVVKDAQGYLELYDIASNLALDIFNDKYDVLLTDLSDSISNFKFEITNPLTRNTLHLVIDYLYNNQYTTTFGSIDKQLVANLKDRVSFDILDNLDEDNHIKLSFNPKKFELPIDTRGTQGLPSSIFRIPDLVKTNLIQIPTIGSVEVVEPYDKLFNTNYKKFFAYIKCIDNNFYLVYQYNEKEYLSNGLKAPIGIDLGLKTLATLSNGTIFKSYNHISEIENIWNEVNLVQNNTNLDKSERNAQIKDLYSKAYKLTYKWYERVSHQILDINAPYIVIETLDFDSMKKDVDNTLLKRADLPRFVNIFTNLALTRGTQVVYADQYFPSSRICSNCGHYDHFLTLSDRTYNCTECGLQIDRDLNASINLSQYTSHY